MLKALVVDQDPSRLMLISDFLEDRGFETQTAVSLAQAHDALDPPPDLCVFDLDLPGGDGSRMVDIAARHDIDLVLLTSQRDEKPIGSPCQYVTKPVSRIKLDDVLTRIAMDDRHEPQRAGKSPASEIIGQSPAMQRLVEALARIGASDATVLITGESGTGKELVASALHAYSSRAKGPYVSLNCGAVTATLIESELFGHQKGSFTGASRTHAGYFERANGGTLFLDEITEMPLDLQVRLLRVLETRRVSRVGSAETIPVDVRIIAATNRDPHEAVREGKLREDLLYRLQVIPLQLPPLRARAGDVRILARHFLTQLNEANRTNKVFSELALIEFEGHDYPGNVRELYNLVQRAYVMTDGRVIGSAGVDKNAWAASGEQRASSSQVGFQVGDTLAAVERRVIEQTLQRCKTKDEAARILGVSTKTLYNKLRRYQTEHLNSSIAGSRHRTGAGTH